MRFGFRAFCCSVATVVVLAACGGDGYGYGPSQTPDPTSGTPSSTNAVSVTDNQFTPSAVQVPVGATVTWTWGSNRSDHNVTFADGTKSATQGNNTTYSRTFSAAGVYTYQCTIHPGMVGSVTVK